MYITFFAGSPCAKTVSFARDLAIFLPKRAESRKVFTLEAEVFALAFLDERAAPMLRYRRQFGFAGRLECSVAPVASLVLFEVGHAVTEANFSIGERRCQGAGAALPFKFPICPSDS